MKENTDLVVTGSRSAAYDLASKLNLSWGSVEFEVVDRGDTVSLDGRYLVRMEDCECGDVVRAVLKMAVEMWLSGWDSHRGGFGSSWSWCESFLSDTSGSA